MKMSKTVIRRMGRLLLMTSLSLGLGSVFLHVWQRDLVLAQQTVTVINAASFNPDRIVAPDSIAAAFGAFVTQGNQSFSANTLPLPTTLGGVRVTINGVNAGLFFVGPTQINL